MHGVHQPTAGTIAIDVYPTRLVITMSKNQRQPPRKPATKFAHLQKKMQKQKVQAKKARKK